MSEGTASPPAASPARELWQSRIRRLLLTPALLVTVLVVAAAWLLDLKPFGEKTTLGRIFVDTPEIYTRERLVNDRFLQDAWLSRELERDAVPGHQTFSDRRSAFFRAGGAGEGAAAAAADSAKTTGEDKEGELRLSSRAQLLEAVDYRDVVRNLAIENQLDDRHDLNGNSLYKFKFDAAVLPGTNTQASAQISIRLRGPSFLATSREEGPLRSLSALGSAEDIEGWRKLYSKWIENLRSRLNQTQKEIKQAFHNNEFAHNDYARVIAFLNRNLSVTTEDVPACSTEIVELHGQERKPLRLPPQEHMARKACVTALIQATVLKLAYVVPPEVASNAPPKFGEYQQDAEPVRQESEADRAKVVDQLLDYWLNSYCATKTMQLVLGLAVPESSFVGKAYYTIPALQTLVRLTFFNPIPEKTEDDVFTVKQRVAAIAAIDLARVKEKDLQEVYRKYDEYWVQLYKTKSNPGQRAAYQDFAANLLPNVRFNVSSIDLKEIENDDIDLTGQSFQEVFGGEGVYVAKAEVGLLNFARMARKHVTAFTYSVTPKESSDSVSFTLSTDSRVDGRNLLPGEAGTAALQMRREALSRTLERRNAVVGFSVFTNDGSAEFGWLISPRHTAIVGQRQVQVQTPGQYPLSALVSLPSWWNQVRLEVTTSWIGKDGEIVKAAEPVEHVVDVPTDFEPLEAILLGIEQLGPELMESRLDPVLLTACRPGDIVIPGRRLWRSTKVTLGYQTANSIAVLPNMKGIIARFSEVQNQVSVSEAEDHPTGRALEILRTVRVWTSQGSLTLPTPARIGIPDDCPAQGAPGASGAKR
jgi:hypothetical protein